VHGGELVTADAVNFMAMHGRGLVCLSMTEERLRQLGIPLMAPDAPSVVRRSYGASIEARRGVTTGISAHDRATTIQGRDGVGGAGRTTSSCPGMWCPSSAAAAACWRAPA
jgi:3,4-dihydroxy-2-butanone 4-phosphate synthase